MKVMIEGDLDQVLEAMNLGPPPTSRQISGAEKKARREKFAARRKVVVDAFRLARSSGAEQEKAALLEAIRRTSGVTDDDLKLARQVLADTNGER